MIVVTGGSGFIGSSLIAEINKRGRTDIILVDDISDTRKLKNVVRLEFESFINKHDFINLLKSTDHSIQRIYHYGAESSTTCTDSEYLMKNNYEYSKTIIEECIKQNIPLQYASSAAVYGNSNVFDDTSDNYEPTNVYGYTKLLTDRLARKHIGEAYIQGLRFFNVYGPKQDPKNPYSGVISIFIEKILCGEPVTINGGYQVRDFIYINDIVDVLIKSMNLLHNKNICNYCNVGTGVTVSIDELLLSLKNITKANPKIIRKDLPEGDPELSSGTYEKINSLLNIDINSFCDLESGLEKTFNYFNKEKLE